MTIEGRQPMPRENNVETVNRMLGMLVSGDREAIRELIPDWVRPDAEWMPLLVGVEGGPYIGPDGATAWFDDLLDSFDVRLESSKLRALGDDGVLLLATLHLVGRESGADVVQEVGITWEFEDEKLRRGRVYATHAEALAATDARIERLRAFVAAIEGGDLDQLKRLIGETVHEDCEWSALIAVVQGRSYDGRAGMIEFFEDLVGSFEVQYVGPEFRPLGGDAILMLTTMRLRGRESGIGIEQELGVLYEYDGELLRRGSAFESHAEAIAAAEALDAQA